MRIKDEYTFANTSCNVIGLKFDGTFLSPILYISILKAYFHVLWNNNSDNDDNNTESNINDNVTEALYNHSPNKTCLLVYTGLFHIIFESV